ncbi:MAG: dihydroneopterin aldolase [Alphaproteobacteria bacterium]|nr:dihydroneopterin aldolase [Alphaproteobacteria bacterium]
MMVDAQTIFIRDLIVMMSIGVREHEKKAPQRVIVNVEALLRALPASDELQETVCYERMAHSIADLASARHYNLVETFAREIFDTLRGDARIQHLKIRIEKPDILPNAAGVGVEISGNL